jgi:cytochrome c oxidase subunit 1
MHFIGLDGVPRRYYAFTSFEYMKDWLEVNKFITFAAFAAGIGQLIFLYNFFVSMFKGKVATQNPWNANTLEWTTGVKGIHGNWVGEIPSVYRWPYDYSKPGSESDFIPQTVPYTETISSNIIHDFGGMQPSEYEKLLPQTASTPVSH